MKRSRRAEAGGGGRRLTRIWVTLAVVVVRSWSRTPSSIWLLEICPKWILEGIFFF